MLGSLLQGNTMGIEHSQFLHQKVRPDTYICDVVKSSYANMPRLTSHCLVKMPRMNISLRNLIQRLTTLTSSSTRITLTLLPHHVYLRPSKAHHSSLSPRSPRCSSPISSTTNESRYCQCPTTCYTHICPVPRWHDIAEDWSSNCTFRPRIKGHDTLSPQCP